MSGSVLLVAVTAVGLLTLGIALSVMIESFLGTVSARSVLVSLAVTAVAWGAWLMVAALLQPDLGGQSTPVVAALAGVGAVLAVASSRMPRIGLARLLVFSTLWVVAGFTPVAVSLFSLRSGFLGNTLATLDLAGALPVLVTAGATGIVLSALDRRSTRPTGVPSPRRQLGITMLPVVWALWLVWMVGLEGAIDSVTPGILLSGVLAPIASLAAWLVVQRVRRADTTMEGVAAGIFCGLVAITPGSGYLGAVGAILIGIIAGTACSLVGFSVLQRTGRPAWMLGIILVAGAGLGTGLLGAFATRFGLMFTGQPEVLMSQFASAILAMLWSAMVAVALWFLVIRPAARPGGRAWGRAVGRPAARPGGARADLTG